MSKDPRTPPPKIFRDHGICVMLDQVVGVVKYRGKLSSSIKVLLVTGQEIYMEWAGMLDEASVVYDRLSDAMETFHR